MLFFAIKWSNLIIDTCKTNLQISFFLAAFVRWHLLVFAATTVLPPEVRSKRLHTHKITAKEVKRNNAPSNQDEDLTYATSSSETTSASSEHEQYKVHTSVMET